MNTRACTLLGKGHGAVIRLNDESNDMDFQQYINGSFLPAKQTLDVLNPASGEKIGSSAISSTDDVAAAVAAAKAAQPAWVACPAPERAAWLVEIADGIRARFDELASVLVTEQSKVRSLAEVEVGFTADYLEYMAGWGRRIEGEILESDRPGEQILLHRKPHGVVAGILPWNFPFFLIARKFAPAMVTGNTVVIKPSEETPLNCQIFAEIVAETGLPAGVFNTIGGDGAVGQMLCTNPDVAMISFTGSVAAGKAIMSAAAGHVAKVSLELGGNAPAIVMDDADLEVAAQAVYDSRVINTGQVCNCVERVYVHADVAEEFQQILKTKMEATTWGNPGEQDVTMGSLINAKAIEKVTRLVEASVSQGATVVTGGQADSDTPGHHFRPTILTGCGPEMPVMREEIFGPVIPIQTFTTLDEALALANDTTYGLTSSIYTKSLDNAFKAIKVLDFGETYVNRENFEAMQGFHAGTKQSGIGGADGKHGLYEFTRTQVSYIQLH